MKIAYLSQTVFPSFQAHTIQIVCMCEAFAIAGHEVLLTARKAESWEKLNDFYRLDANFQISSPWVPPLPGRQRLFGIRAARNAREFGADLVYGRCLHSCVASVAYGLPTIFEAHTPLRYFGKLSRTLFNRMIGASAFERLVVISDALAREYVSDGVAREKIVVAPDATKQKKPSAINHPHDEKMVVGYAGSMYRGKGVEVVAALTEVCPWAMFLVAGGPSEEAVKWEEKSNPDNSLYLGAVEPADIQEILSVCDVLIAPYQEPCFDCSNKDISKWMSPLKLFDYMEAGKAIISSDLPVIREIADDTVIKFCPPADMGAWRTALKEFADCPELRQKYSQAAQEHVHNRYWNARASQVLARL